MCWCVYLILSFFFCLYYKCRTTTKIKLELEKNSFVFLQRKLSIAFVMGGPSRRNLGNEMQVSTLSHQKVLCFSYVDISLLFYVFKHTHLCIWIKKKCLWCWNFLFFLIFFFINFFFIFVVYGYKKKIFTKTALNSTFMTINL